MQKIIFVLTLITALLAGCATNSYREPKTSEGPVATIQGFKHSNGLYDWHNGIITAIDNKDTSPGYFDLSPINHKIPVVPGKHAFVANSTFNRTMFGSGPYETFADLQANLAPNQAYFLNGSVEGASIKLWIEDASGKVVSPIVLAPYRTTPKQTYVYMPMATK